MKYTTDPIRFTSNDGYRHVLNDAFQINLKQTFKAEVKYKDVVSLGKNGVLTLSSGYAWDGVSFPVLNVDSCQNLRAAIVHDALYQLMRHNDKFRTKENRRKADRIFRELLVQDGVDKFVARIFWLAVRRFGEPGTREENRLDVGQSPCPNN